MAKIKLVVSATIEETFSDFIISKKTKGLAEKTLQSYQSQFQAVARHMDVKMDIAMLQNFPFFFLSINIITFIFIKIKKGLLIWCFINFFRVARDTEMTMPFGCGGRF